MKVIFHKEYPDFGGNKQHIDFPCSNCGTTVPADIPVAESGIEEVQCPNCGKSYDAEVNRNVVGGDITIR